MKKEEVPDSFDEEIKTPLTFPESSQQKTNFLAVVEEKGDHESCSAASGMDEDSAGFSDESSYVSGNDNIKPRVTQ